MKTNLIFICTLFLLSFLFFIAQVIKLKKEVNKLNKITEHLLNKSKSNNE